MAGFYRSAAITLKRLEKRNCSLKSIVFCSKSTSLRVKKRLYAILYKTIRYKKILSNVVSASKLMEKEPKLLSSYHLCLLLVCDILYGKGLQCGGRLKSSMRNYTEELKSCWKQIKDSCASSSFIILPKYVRVNTLKGRGVCDIICELEKEGYVKKNSNEICSCKCFGDGDAKMKNCFSQDEIIREVLMLCHCTELLGSRFYSESQLIIQDKASCLPAHILAPPHNSHVIDACAAPGNKTTHLSSIMKNSGSIYAFDKDPNRCEVLIGMIEKAGATNVIVQLSDFLQVDPSGYKDVTHILVDPSCSGSGMYSRLNYDTTVTKNHKRLAQLNKFQCQILDHALSFPSVERVVYSTCSINREENEYVVRNVLLKNSTTFEIAHILPEWPSRGLPVFTKAECCIRASAEDRTNGFFVAMFQRLTGRPHLLQLS